MAFAFIPKWRDSLRVALPGIELHNSSVLLRGGSMKNYTEKFCTERFQAERREKM